MFFVIFEFGMGWTHIHMAEHAAELSPVVSFVSEILTWEAR